MGARLKGAGRRLGRLFWRPLRLLARAGRALARALWRFLGRLGLASRNLLTWFAWIPFLVLTTPLRLYYNRFLRRPVNLILGPPWRAVGRFGLLLRRGLAALLRLLRRAVRRGVVDPVRRRWRAGAAWRRERRLAWRSWWLTRRARWRVALRRRRPPAGAVYAPRVTIAGAAGRRRFVNSYITVASTVAVILFALAVIVRQNLPDPTPVDAAAADATPALAPTAVPILPTPTLPWPTPDPLGQGGTVAFSERRNGNDDIFALAVGQAQPIRLTNHTADDRDPAWSPDGRQLAFASHRSGNWDIFVLDLPSGQLRQLTDQPGFDSAPSWSPDGAWIVYESYQEDNLDLFIVRSDASRDPIRLTEHPAADFSPVWSPTGRHIAFTSARSGNHDIFIISLDEASDETAVNITLSPAEQEDAPAFHPDGSFLAYDENSTGFELIYAVPLVDGRLNGARLTLGQGRRPAWSPDGEEIVFAHSRGPQDYLIAAAIDAFRVAPQAFVSPGRLDQPAWTAVTLPRELNDYLRAVNAVEDAPLFTELLGEPQIDGPPYLLWEVNVNAPSPFLNDRVDQSFNALRAAVVNAAGWDFLGQVEQMYEPLELRPLPGLSERNWNKAGRAFDIYYRHALAFDPQVEVVREDRGNETYWRIYLKAARQDGSQGEPLRQLPWDFRSRFGADPRYYDEGGKPKETLPIGYYVDFTALAADFGWLPVPADGSWRTYFPATRFWHYENRQGLSWEQAMLELYAPEAVADRFGGR